MLDLALRKEGVVAIDIIHFCQPTFLAKVNNVYCYYKPSALKKPAQRDQNARAPTHLLDLVKKKTKYRPSQSINLLLILTLNSFI